MLSITTPNIMQNLQCEMELWCVHSECLQSLNKGDNYTKAAGIVILACDTHYQPLKNPTNIFQYLRVSLISSIYPPNENPFEEITIK